MALTETDATRTGTGRSTGTAEGKARSSMNAVTHGLTAKAALIPGEDPAAYREFMWEVVEDLAPVGRVERELAARAGVFMWKRRRVEEAERQVMAELSQRYVRQPEGDDRDDDPQEAWADREVPVDPADPLKLVRFMIADEFATVKPTQLERLAYYERRIDQQIDSALRTLIRLQNRRQMQGRQAQRQEKTEERPKWQGQLRSDPGVPVAGAQPVGPAVPLDTLRAAPAGTTAPKSVEPPPPPAPAQNELSPETVLAPETGPPETAGDTSRVL